MRKIIVLFLLAVGNLFSQSTLVGTNKIWTIAEGASAGYSGIYYYYLKGDTTINSNNYQKLNWSTDYTIFSTPFDSLPISSFSQSYYRESQGKVYRWYSNGNSECLLYDYNLAVGDTFTQSCFGVHQVVVQSIDSVLQLNGIWSKRINFDNGNFWIERVGARDGIVFDDVFINGVDINSTISCVFENGVHIFENNSINNCFYIETIQDEESKKNQQLIILDGTSRTMQIKDAELDSRFQVFDATGRNVMQGYIHSKLECIDVSFLKPAIYGLVIQSGTNFYFHRIAMN